MTAAAIHLGLMPDVRPAKDCELLAAPYFDAQVSRDHGRIRFIGYDEAGHEIYIVGKRHLGDEYERIMRRVIEMLGGYQEEYAFVNTMPYVNLWMMIGGFLSRRWGWTRLGRKIILHGTRQSYFKFVQLVAQVKEKIRFRKKVYQVTNEEKTEPERMEPGTAESWLFYLTKTVERGQIVELAFAKATGQDRRVLLLGAGGEGGILRASLGDLSALMGLGKKVAILDISDLALRKQLDALGRIMDNEV